MKPALKPGIEPETEEEFMRLFFNETTLNYALKQSNKHLIEKHSKNASFKYKRLTLIELKQCLAIHMQLGLVSPSNFEHCWDKSKRYSYNDSIAFLMCKKRFKEINQSLIMISKKDIVNNKMQ